MEHDNRQAKSELLQQISTLDLQADSTGVDEEALALRYHLEEELMHIYEIEEEHWKQRGKVKWALQADTNTSYFHAIANGRYRKCMITALNSPSGVISDPKQNQDHVYAFYSDLLGISAQRSCSLA
jgi:hypothetical protein